MAKLSDFKILFLLMVLVDQGSKWLANFIGVPIIFNTGISFGLGSEASRVVSIFLVISIAGAVFFGLKNYWQKNLVLAGIFFGAVFSNLLDRVLHGAVVDWLIIPVVNLQNNLADIMIVGILLFKVLPDLMIKRKYEN